jgi:hypothetical protein
MSDMQEHCEKCGLPHCRCRCGEEQKPLKERKPLSVHEALRQEAAECRKSSADHRNLPENTNIFYLVSIILDGVADRIDPPKT